MVKAKWGHNAQKRNRNIRKIVNTIIKMLRNLSIQPILFDRFSDTFARMQNRIKWYLLYKRCCLWVFNFIQLWYIQMFIFQIFWHVPTCSPYIRLTCSTVCLLSFYRFAFFCILVHHTHTHTCGANIYLSNYRI